MNKILIGAGLGLGGGLAYLLYTDEVARLIALFVAGGLVIGLPAILTAFYISRQWSRALGGQMERQAGVTNQYYLEGAGHRALPLAQPQSWVIPGQQWPALTQGEAPPSQDGGVEVA